MLTPIDIETVEFKKVGRGYAPESVDEFLNKVVEDFEALYKENSALKDRIKNLEESVTYYKSMEETLKNSIIMAEKTSRQAKRNAAETAENIIRKARLKADEIVLNSNSRKYEIESKVIDLKSRYEALSASIKNILSAELEYVNNSEKLLSESILAGKVTEQQEPQKKQESTPEHSTDNTKPAGKRSKTAS